MALIVRVKPGAERQIDAAAVWWSENRPAAPGAIRSDLKAALEALVEQPGIGTLVENTHDPETRRLYLARTRYFVYYRPSGPYLEVVAFWHSSREHGPSVCREVTPRLPSCGPPPAYGVHRPLMSIRYQRFLRPQA